MGISFSLLFKKIGCGREFKIIMDGLDSAGKSTILYKLKTKETINNIPTIGFNVESISYGNTNLCVWTRKNKTSLVNIFSSYKIIYRIIYVIDSSDRERFQDAKDELEKLLKEDELSGASILILCNKDDLPNVMSVEEISEKLIPMLSQVVGRKFHFQSICAINGKGLNQSMDWLSKNIYWK